jgi:gas vesicle protein
MMETRSFSGAQLLTAFATGAAAGAAVAILTAPRSGKEAREALKAMARDVRGKAGRIPHAVGQAVERATLAGKEAFAESYRGNSVPSDG